MPWNAETLYPPASGLFPTAVVYGGQLHVFTCTSGLDHRWWDGTRWNFEVLDSGATIGITSFNVAATEFNGELHLFYRYAQIGIIGLRHGWWDGTQWNFETLDVGNSNGESSAAAVYDGQLHVFTTIVSYMQRAILHHFCRARAWKRCIQAPLNECGEKK
jgi:hypothetical protein